MRAPKLYFFGSGPAVGPTGAVMSFLTRNVAVYCSLHSHSSFFVLRRKFASESIEVYFFLITPFSVFSGRGVSHAKRDVLWNC